EANHTNPLFGFAKDTIHAVGFAADAGESSLAVAIYADPVVRSAQYTTVALGIGQDTNAAPCRGLQPMRLVGPSLNADAGCRLAGDAGPLDALTNDAPTGCRDSMHADARITLADHARTGNKGALFVHYQAGERPADDSEGVRDPHDSGFAKK